MCRVMSPSTDAKLYSRAYNTDAAFPLWVAQALHSSGTLIKGGESGTQIRRITTVCGADAGNSFLCCAKYHSAFILPKTEAPKHTSSTLMKFEAVSCFHTVAFAVLPQTTQNGLIHTYGSIFVLSI